MSSTSPEAAAFEGAIRFVRRHAAGDAQARLLEAALAGRPDRDPGVGEQGYRRFVRIPRAVAAAVCGDAARAQPLTVALALLHTGLDTLDDLMDGDPRAWWQGFRSAEVLLAGATLVSALPQLLIAELDAPPETIARMQRALAEAGMVISAGQQRDIAGAGRDDLTVEDVTAVVVAKSGEVHGLAAKLAAQLAGADDEMAACYHQMGRALGAAAQFVSDCYDIVVAPDSRDLRQGTRTLPVVLALTAMKGDERTGFCSLLKQAETDAVARTAIRQRLLEAGVVRRAAMTIDIYCRRAYAALANAGASGSAKSDLEQLIRDCSLLEDA
ncbi:MAG: polyprenyl synthetase family protein [Dehalococcoidia bacterium]